MSSAKELMEGALRELAAVENSPRSSAIKELIRVEKNYYYSARGNAGKLKEIREIINKYYSIEVDDNAD